MKQTDSDAVVLDCDLPEPRDKVWRALTEKELLAAWLLPNDIRPEVGAKFCLQPAPAGGEPPTSGEARAGGGAHAGGGARVACAPIECEVLVAEPGRILRWRQREPADAVGSRRFVESVVSFELADLPGGGTHLRVVHDGFETVTCTATVLEFPTRTRATITSLRMAA
jgi:uncharacterized protein YndB with AHSA1/START domain